MPQRIPNLFVVGAPKCGTTALSNYLAGHPMIFMSEQSGMKEPYYFASDITQPRDIFGETPRTLEDYAALFDDAGEDVRYVGEASAGYLYSRAAIPSILKVVPSARLVVLLRNPLEMIEAQHNQFFKYGHENQSFESAWRLQDARSRGRNIPSPWETGELLQYGPMAKTGEQMQRLLGIAKPEQIFVAFYEDFASNPAHTYRELLRWLDLPDDERLEFPRLNQRIYRRSQRLELQLQWLRRQREKLRIPGGLGIHALIERFNRTERKPLRPEFERELKDYFRQDVELLSQLVGRDLSHWTE